MCLESFEKEIDNTLFRTYEKRLSSFKRWKGKLNPEVLASAGFYYLSVQDACKCFYCGAEIFEWAYDDYPIEEHYKLWKNCDLIECLRLSENKKFENKKYENKKYEKPLQVKADMSVVVFFILINIFVSIICQFI